MNVLHRLLPCLLIAFVLLSVSCGHKQHTPAEIESAMQRYDHFIKEVNADSMAMMFTPDGNLGNVARGQDSIRRFLAGFANVRVLDMASATTAIELGGDSATQTGTYRQTAILPKQDTVRVKGNFTARWQWTDQAGWRLKSMLTTPTN